MMINDYKMTSGIYPNVMYYITSAILHIRQTHYGFTEVVMSGRAVKDMARLFGDL